MLTGESMAELITYGFSFPPQNGLVDSERAERAISPPGPVSRYLVCVHQLLDVQHSYYRGLFQYWLDTEY